MLFLHILTTTFLFYFANAQYSGKLRDGSKAAFIQEPFVNIIPNKIDMQNDVILHWPKGIVTYRVDHLSYSKHVMELILEAISVIESSSCIKFERILEQSENKTWLHITNPSKERECVHEPKFKPNGEIILVLGLDCLRSQDILHTLLHGIGFQDEVTHPHRDKYIRVLWSNIHPGYRQLYRKQQLNVKNIVEYDPLSVMHFHDRAFSMNGRATVAPLEPGLVISPSENLSQLDQMRLQLEFGHECNKRKVNDLMETCKTGLQGDDQLTMLKQDVDDENAGSSNAVDEENADSSNVVDEENVSNVDFEKETFMHSPTSNDMDGFDSDK